MTKKIKATHSAPKTVRSSITVSEQIVCEGDACIGRSVAATEASPTGKAQSATREKPSGQSSISVGGKTACTDDACIGKT